MVGIKQNRSLQDENSLKLYSSLIITRNHAVFWAGLRATSTNLIVDARPTANAVANTAKGAGTENMDNYKDARKVYSA